MIKVNGIDINYLVFSDGAVHVNLPKTLDVNEDYKDGEVFIEAFLKNSNDIVAFFLTLNAIRKNHLDVYYLYVYLRYLPFGRQDRVCALGDAFSLEWFLNTLKQFNINQLHILEPHSLVVKDFFPEVLIDSTNDLIKSKILTSNITIVCPDKGAISRLEDFRDSYDIIYASKVRNPKNGQITGTVFEGDVKGKELIILDDICDGGRTFIELAKVLLQGAKSVELYVVHGIFSKGLEVLKPYIKKVYCYQTFLPKDKIDNDYLTILRED